MLHRTRELLVRQRTMLVNALRGHLAELGIVAPQGIARAAELAAVLMDEDDTRLPALGRQALRELAAELDAVGLRVKQIEAAILAWHKDNEASDPTLFHSARQFAAWIGLVPRQNSSGGKQCQGDISKQGDRTLCRLLVLGATAVIRHVRTKPTADVAWLRGVLERRPTRLARPRWRVLRRPAAALIQPNGSSIRLRRRWLTA